jgi:hypothetical protein
VSASEELLGKRVLVGVTCVDTDGEEIARFQTHGLLTEVREDAILLARDDGSVFGLPPAPELLDRAEPGVYTLRETGEAIEDPDLLASLTVTVSDQDSVGELRAHGFSPPDFDQAS